MCVQQWDDTNRLHYFHQYERIQYTNIGECSILFYLHSTIHEMREFFIESFHFSMGNIIEFNQSWRAMVRAKFIAESTISPMFFMRKSQLLSLVSPCVFGAIPIPHYLWCEGTRFMKVVKESCYVSLKYQPLFVCFLILNIAHFQQ